MSHWHCIVLYCRKRTMHRGCGACRGNVLLTHMVTGPAVRSAWLVSAFADDTSTNTRRYASEDLVMPCARTNTHITYITRRNALFSYNFICALTQIIFLRGNHANIAEPWSWERDHVVTWTIKKRNVAGCVKLLHATLFFTGFSCRGYCAWRLSLGE